MRLHLGTRRASFSVRRFGCPPSDMVRRYLDRDLIHPALRNNELRCRAVITPLSQR